MAEHMCGSRRGGVVKRVKKVAVMVVERFLKLPEQNGVRDLKVKWGGLWRLVGGPDRSWWEIGSMCERLQQFEERFVSELV